MGKLNGTTKGLRTGRYQGCNHVDRVRIERFLATGASIKGAARELKPGEIVPQSGIYTITREPHTPTCGMRSP